MAEPPEGNELKIFIVRGEYSNSTASRMAHFGDDYGEKYPFAKYVIATSPTAAILLVKERFEGEVEAFEKAREAAIELRKKVDRPLDRMELVVLGAAFPPDIPRNVEKWTAQELKFQGYRIVIEEIPPQGPN